MPTNICIAVKPGRNGSCVCSRRVKPHEAAKLGIVSRRDRRAQTGHFKTYSDLCREAGLFKIGTTDLREQGETVMAGSGYAAPSIEEYGDLGIVGALKSYMPGKVEVINMMKGGAGAVGAFLIADQLIPRIPWLSDRIASPTSGLYWGIGTKLAMAFIAGKLVAKVDPYMGSGIGVGFIASAMYDVLDEFVFKGAAPGGTATAGLHGSAWNEAETKFFGADIDQQANKLFADLADAQSDVEVLEPDDADLFGIEVVEQDNPLFGLGDMGQGSGVGTFLT